jgi:3,4-dihydroxy-2-butanone 4-phosphate synthase
MFELYTIYQLRMLDITMTTVICTLVHVADDKKRLGFVNPIQINQLELNLVINEKSDMFKGMSKKKRATTIKKAQQNLTKEKRDLASTHIGQLF